MTALRTLIGSRVLDLRSPDSGTIGQGARFALVGCAVALVYLTTTTVLADVLGLPFQIALVVGFVTAVCVHFTLQRLFVWVHRAEFALNLGEQIGRYLLVVSAQYVVTATSTALLPSVIGMPVTFVYVMTVLALTGGNFLFFRNGVFHATE